MVQDAFACLGNSEITIATRRRVVGDVETRAVVVV